MLRQIADKHKASIAAVATRYVLQRTCVAAVLIGARHAGHLADTMRLFDFELDEEDLSAIRKLTDKATGPTGDVYSLERMKGGKHATIMKYNLNRCG